MEKVVYALWRDSGVAPAEFNRRLLDGTAERLIAAGARGLRINVSDEAVAPATGLRQTSSRPQMEAVVQLWVDCAHDSFREPFDAAVRAAAPHMAAYLVTEAQPIRNTLHPPETGKRTEGWSQIVFLGRPPRLTYEAWIDAWLRLHTPVAVETQSNFEYIQNIVARPLTYAAPPYAAMVEECFPAAAMTDQHAFYDAVGDDERYKRNLDAMMESCARFIDFDRVDVIPTSQYVLKSVG